MVLTTEFITFPERHDRTRYVCRRFANYLQQSVLDVGCFEAPLRKMLADATYTGVDFAGDPDIQLNLDQCESLPFEDNSFHCVICIEVLEHLENLHRLFDQLVRVSDKYVIVSLPNCWSDARVKIERGKGSFLHYGLPAARPLDRHRWFFSLSQAREFLEQKAQEHNLSVSEMFITEKPRNPLLRWLRKLRYPGERYNNRYSQTIWTVFCK